MRKILLGILLAMNLTNPIVQASADPVIAAVGGLATVAAYNSSLKSILELGNNVHAQIASRKQDLKENGEDKNSEDVEVINRVMNRLINEGKYFLKVNSLPFIWSVNDSELFNASCYPTDYISVNRGLVTGFNRNEDELAAVLAHEMTHGLEQHSAKNYAMAVAQHLGAGFLAIGASNVDWSRLSGMVHYSVAQSVSIPSEYEADEIGFYIAASAGFNPGGGAAAMVKMNHYFKYETTNFLEYDPGDNVTLHEKRRVNPKDMSDHPETENRELKLSQMLTDYSGGRVWVNRKNAREYEVYIDGSLRETFRDSKDLLAGERAYLAAGKFAREFHVETDFERSLKEKWIKNQDESINAEKKFVQMLRSNADAYVDYEFPDLAMTQLNRALAAVNQDDQAELLSIRGRVFAANGDFETGFKDSNRAVELDPKNFAIYLNRADVYRMHGEIEKAVEDANRALELDPKKFISYKFLGDMFDKIGDKDRALENFREVYRITKEPRSIPLEYLEKIDPKASKELKKKEKS